MVSLVLTVLAFLGSFLLGGAVVANLWRESRASWARMLFQCTTAWGLGAGLTSALYFMWLRVAGRASPGFLIVQALIILFGWTVYYVRRDRQTPAPGSLSPASAGPLTHLGLVLLLAWGILTLLCLILRLRWGGWDAVAVWNAHAKSFASPIPGDWRGAFGTSMTHPDYPPLLPLFVAQAWACSGVTTPFVPTLVALSFGSATGLLLISSVSFLRSPHAGLLAGGLLLTSPIFLAAAMIQYADIPLSFYMLLAVVLFYCADQRGDRGLYVLAGLAAACAALTKNEGSFFLVVLASARMVRFCLRRQIRQELRALAPLALGLTPLILALLYYKSFASPNELINQHGGYSAKLLSGSRYLAIAKAAYEGILHPRFLAQSAGFKVGLNWQVPAFVIFSLLVGFERKRALHPSVVFMSVTALFIYLGYFLVYVLTPYELEWHLRTSIDRLLAQPAPILICAAVLSLGSFEPGNDTSPSAP